MNFSCLHEIVSYIKSIYVCIKKCILLIIAYINNYDLIFFPFKVYVIFSLPLLSYVILILYINFKKVDTVTLLVVVLQMVGGDLYHLGKNQGTLNCSLGIS